MAAGALQPFDIKDPKSWGPAYGSWINQQPATAQVLATTMLGGLQVNSGTTFCLVQAVSPGLVHAKAGVGLAASSAGPFMLLPWMTLSLKLSQHCNIANHRTACD